MVALHPLGPRLDELDAGSALAEPVVVVGAEGIEAVLVLLAVLGIEEGARIGHRLRDHRIAAVAHLGRPRPSLVAVGEPFRMLLHPCVRVPGILLPEPVVPRGERVAQAEGLAAIAHAVQIDPHLIGRRIVPQALDRGRELAEGKDRQVVAVGHGGEAADIAHLNIERGPVGNDGADLGGAVPAHAAETLQEGIHRVAGALARVGVGKNLPVQVDIGKLAYQARLPLALVEGQRRAFLRAREIPAQAEAAQRALEEA